MTMFTTKKIAVRIGVAAVFCFMLAGIARGEESRKGKLSLRFNGGLSFIDVKDINDCIRSRKNNPANYPRVDWEETKTHSEFSLEAIYFLTERIGIGLGAGYAGFNNSGSYETDPYTTRHEEWKWSAIPVFSSLYVLFPMRSRWTVIVKGGAGYYFGSLDGYKDVQWDYRPDVLDYGISQGDIKATSGAFAVNVGLGIDFRIGKKLSFALEANYRLLKMKDFKGTETAQAYQNGVLTEASQEEGYLWHCEYGSASIHDSFFQNEPLGNLQVQRHAVYDMSGLTLRLGVTYSFASLFTPN